MSHSQQQIFAEIQQSIIKKLGERDIQPDVKFIEFVGHLMARDLRQGLPKSAVEKPSHCKLNSFIDGIVNGYLNPSDLTMANLRMSWIMKTGHGIQLSYVREQYEEKFQQQLKVLIDDILQYPETCSKVQLDQLFAKMQVFIVASYQLGCPKNHVLLKLTAQALNSVIGRSDLQNYVLKKRYHRQEYLERLASTVAGIVIYNNDGPDGDRENVHYVISDLDMAQRNTSAAFATTLEQLRQLCGVCQAAMEEQLLFSHEDSKLHYRVPLDHLHRINQFVLTFHILQRSLTALRKSYEHTMYLVTVERERYDCVVAKINETLAMRTAINSELIFPHFVYLSKVWNTLSHYFNHIVELNRLREQLEQQVPSELESLAQQTVADVQALAQRRKDMHTRGYEHCWTLLNEQPIDGNFCNLAEADIQEFCSLSLTLTNGLLLPAKLARKLCLNLDIKFGFHDETYARVAEVRFEGFVTGLRQVIFNSANLCLLFKLDDMLLTKDLQAEVDPPAKLKDFETQTEMLVTNDLSPSNWLNVTWNAWDYHRATLRLAQLRKCQTREVQTKVSYGKRNAQTQAYNVRQHK